MQLTCPAHLRSLTIKQSLVAGQRLDAAASAEARVQRAAGGGRVDVERKGVDVEVLHARNALGAGAAHTVVTRLVCVCVCVCVRVCVCVESGADGVGTRQCRTQSAAAPTLLPE